MNQDYFEKWGEFYKKIQKKAKFFKKIYSDFLF